MLFGTFMPVPSDGEKPTTIKKYAEGHRTAGLDYPAIEAFPIRDVKQATIRALLTKPLFPQAFFIFDTDDFEKYNITKRFKAAKEELDNDAPYSIADLLDESVEDDYAGYLLNATDLDSHVVAYAFPFMFYDFLEGRCQIKDMLPRTDISDDEEVIIRSDLRGTFPDLNEQVNDFKDQNADFDITDDMVYQFKLESSREGFVISFMPFLVNQVLGKPTKLYYLFSSLTSAHKLDQTYRDFFDWTNEDCSVEGFDMLYYPTLNYVLDDEKVMQAIALNMLPERNDPCPCGCGKKFKQCHGRFIGK